ncbi:DMT family transporter [Actinomadura parmotrematis]|uniref:DMT family transporter n=1 Tax=Actinomadura parmotrematis TaxID=2864039 RepID=A0ABS7G4Q8_9ACTN|nr:DMT family transporter [Actinomadura parmotrematis]MBW8487698.1 DMT family transporter [Actinomadura parmotrematis]
MRFVRGDRAVTLLALIASGLLWGITVPLTKVALAGVGPAWLTVARFGLAAVPLALVAGRRGLRGALTWKIVLWGVLGYGLVVVLQGQGIARTSVSHASLIIGATPVLGALLVVLLGRGRVGALSWAGFALALAGIGVVAANGAGGATLAGDLLVLVTVLLTAAFLLAQQTVLAGRSPVAVTAVQFGAAALASAPVAAVTDGSPVRAPGTGPLLAVLALTVFGTLAPYTLFAFGQARVAPEIAGIFLNLEPVVGFALGAVAFGDHVGPAQVFGALAVLGGIALNTLPYLGRRTPPAPPARRDDLPEPEREPALV